MTDDVRFTVTGLPPAKSEAKSMLSEDHPHQRRVRALLASAREALPRDPVSRTALGANPIGLEVTVTAPAAPDSDATNYLGGIADVLEVKHRRGPLPHLGDLAEVALYDNDKQVQEVHYRWRPASAAGYEVHVWRLEADSSPPRPER